MDRDLLDLLNKFQELLGDIRRWNPQQEKPAPPETLGRDEVLRLLCGRFKLMAEIVGPLDYCRIEELAYLLLAVLYGGKAISLDLGRPISLAELLVGRDDDRHPWQRGYVGTHFSTEVPIEDE